jgi:hypothetical protein
VAPILDQVRRGSVPLDSREFPQARLAKFLEQALFRALADDRRKRLFESPYATSLADEE